MLFISLDLVESSRREIDYHNRWRGNEIWKELWRWLATVREQPASSIVEKEVEGEKTHRGMRLTSWGETTHSGDIRVNDGEL